MHQDNGKSLEAKLSSTLLASSVIFLVLTAFIGWQWWQLSQLLSGLSDLGLPAELSSNLSTLKQSNTLLGVAYILVIGTTAYTTYKIKTFVAAHVVEPLQTLTSAAARVGKGELNFPIPKARDEDEIGSLTQAFDAMVIKLREDTSQITDAIDVLTNSVKQIAVSTSQSAASSSQMAATVTETTVSAEEVRQTTMVATQKG
ncbi:MAG TPA: HAMP domain-containing protein, partial [Candidatus Obscuribacter sp.]|nr:HAMP domain-containing protein [Candidatus Obscuribacter sp.]